MTWGDMFDQWPIVDADLHDTYGIDTADTALMASRTWVWLGHRLNGLISIDSRIVGWARKRFEQQHPERG